VLTEDQGQTFAKVCLSKALVYAIFSLYFPCSITYYSILPGEPPEPAVPAADHRVDGVWRRQCRGHLLPHHGVAAALGVPAGWVGGRPGDSEATKLCLAKLLQQQRE